jgi:N-acetylneuraminic acid mutarotase/DNA-binding transcriptional ArsR family regulator
MAKARELTVSAAWVVSHPLRFRIMEVLREGPSTSARIAKRIGESRGGVSYHLRRLAEVGAIEEAPELGTRRERFWRRDPELVVFPADRGAEQHAISQRWAALFFTRDEQVRHRFVTEDVPAEWRESAAVASWFIRLTPEEAAELGARFYELTHELRSREEAPEGAAETLVSVSVLPVLGEVQRFSSTSGGEAHAERLWRDMRRALLPISGVILMAATASAASRWKSMPALPHPRAAHAVVVSGSSIYVLGGPSTAVVDRFDGRHWHKETTLPEGRINAPAAVALDGKIYVIGGFSGSTNAPLDTVEVYDTGTHAWSAAAPLPAPRGGEAAVVLGGKIHVIGGGNSESTIADHSVYDPTTDMWSSAAPVPRAEGSPAAVVLKGKLWAIGGRSGFSDFGTVYVYDPVADSWSKGPSIPPRGTAGAAVFRGAIYVFGGESQAKERTLRDVYELAPGAKRWARVAQLPTARNYARAVVYRRAIYVVGGSTTFGNSHGAEGSRLMDRFNP